MFENELFSLDFTTSWAVMRRSNVLYAAPKFRLLSWLGNSNNDASSVSVEYASEPIADFFPNVTIAFLISRVSQRGALSESRRKCFGY